MTSARSETLDALLQATLVGVVRDADGARARVVAEALLQGGLRAVEITASTPRCFETLASLRAEASRKDAKLGVGTVRSAHELVAAVQAGASFVVSPHTDAALIRGANTHGLVVIPGAATPTEVLTAHQAGADAVKLFPISALGGPRFVRLLRGPIPEVPFWVSGDVAIDEISEYLEAGARLLGLTSAFTAALPSRKIEEAVVERAAAALDTVARARMGRHLLTIITSTKTFRFGLESLQGQPATEQVALEALVPGRRGQAVRVAALLDEAAVPDDAELWLSSLDGFGRRVPARMLREAGVLHFETDGRPLAHGEGGPLRLYLVAGEDRCDNVKALSQIEVVRA